MPQRDDAWLRHQQQRWTRPDAARWIRPDVARFLKPGTNPADVFPALRRKYDGQPRLRDGEGHGQFTFGRRDSDAVDSTDRPRVIITQPDWWKDRADEGESEGGSDNDRDDSFGLGDCLRNLLLAVAIGPGHNNGPPLEAPPEIPKSKPRISPSTILRVAAIWVGRALTLRNLAAVVLFFAALKAAGWAWTKINEIITYLDRPRTMEELQSAVDVPRAGTENHHHKMEQHVSRRLGMTQKQIDAPGNRVRIPKLKHYQISDWYRQPNKDYNDLTPRQFLAGKPPEEHERVGRKALVLFGVLKP